MAMDFRRLRSALEGFGKDVAIVTTRDRSGADVGVAIDSFNPVALDPPLVLWSLEKTCGSRRAFIDSTRFAVNILAADQGDLAARFASGSDVFSGVAVVRGEEGVPLLERCSAWFQCRTVSHYQGVDHEIFAGEVIAYEDLRRPALARSSSADDAGDDFGRNTISHLMARAYYQLQCGIRPELARRNLSEAEYYILAAIALIGPCAVTDVIDTIAVSGHRVTPLDMKRLAERALLAFPDAASRTVHLTASGRETVLRIAAVSKAVEADAVMDLDALELDGLRQALRKIIRRTRSPWHQDETDAGCQLPGPHEAGA